MPYLPDKLLHTSHMNNNSRTLRKRDSAHNSMSRCKTEMVRPYDSKQCSRCKLLAI